MERNSPDESFTANLYQMDVERVRYALTRYLRTRILKIERNLDYIIHSEDMMERLSFAEKLFATKLHDIASSYFDDVVHKRFTEGSDGDRNEELVGIVLTKEDRLKHTKPHFEVCIDDLMIDDCCFLL